MSARNKNSMKWDIKRGYGVYKSVVTKQLESWIREGRVGEGEMFVWKSGFSGWRRPEELDEFKRIFERRKRRKEEGFIRVATPTFLKKKKGRKPPKIFIIDDEKEICWLLENELKERHFNVSSSISGRDGLKLVKKEKPDIVLLDLRLADYNGLDLLRKIKEYRPKTKVIVESAFAGPDVKEKASRLGANAFVDKPFNPKDIIKAVRKV